MRILPANSSQSFSMQQVMNAFQNADVKGRPGPTDAPTADGHLTKAEIQQRLQVLEKPRAPYIRINTTEIKILHLLEEHFDQIAGADLHQETVRGILPAPVKSITPQELRAFAAHDGKPNQLSNTDSMSQTSPNTNVNLADSLTQLQQFIYLFLQSYGLSK